MNEKPYIVHSALVTFILTAIYIPAITITAEFVPPLKSWLASTYGHHWVGKGIIMMIFYAVVFLTLCVVFKRQNKQVSAGLIKNAAIMAIISSVTITLFFIYEYLQH